MGTNTGDPDPVFEDANVLVTGGAGSIGRTLVSRLTELDVNVVRVFDNNEPNLATMQAERSDGRFRYLAGDVRDKTRLERAMQDIDVVLHTAAMKHVDISEYNPFEAVKTNVVGLQNVVDAAIDAGVQRVVYTSSDKAANPANTMGTTKLLGEKLVTAGNKYSGRTDLRLASVRFGNVLKSSGSVLPLFRDQIREGGPVTLTNPEMTRFFLTEEEMANLVVDAARLTRGGEVFVREMTAMNIGDLAEVMVESLADRYGYDPDTVDIDVVGRRVGETTHEEIMTAREAERAIENDGVYAIPPDAEADRYLQYREPEDFEPTTGLVRSSANADLLDEREIHEFLREAGVLER